MWVNKNTGKKVSKTYKNAILREVKVENEYLISNKLRFKLIHQNDKKNFIEMVEDIKKILLKFEIKLFSTESFYLLKKKYIKKKIKKNGTAYYVNDHNNQYKGVFRDYKQRAVKIYNMFINAFNMACMDARGIDIKELHDELEHLSEKYKSNALKYEQSLLDLINLVAEDKLDLYFSKN